MKSRKEIRTRQNDIIEEIQKLKKEWNNLEIEYTLLCDDTQWFTEVEEEVVISKRPKKTETQLIGRRHWNEDFKDDGTGEVVTIERSEIVRINKEWLIVPKQ